MRSTDTPPLDMQRKVLPMTEPILLTPLEAAQVLRIGRSKLYQLLQAGELESVHIGACRRIPAEALNDLVARLRSPDSILTTSA